MTKEYIIAHELGMEYHSATSDQLSVYHRCMDQYGQQQALDFDIWKAEKHIVSEMNAAGEVQYHDSLYRYYEPEQLYNQFIEQQNKP